MGEPLFEVGEMYNNKTCGLTKVLAVSPDIDFLHREHMYFIEIQQEEVIYEICPESQLKIIFDKQGGFDDENE